MNRAATRMLGWTQDELRGRSMHEAVHFQRADATPVSATECPLLQAQAEGRTVRMAEDTFTRKDGSMLPVAYSSAPISIGGEVQGLVVVFRDTTEEQEQRGRIERELAALSWVGRIRDALDEDRFVLYSQPIVAIGSGQISEELLLRMISPTGETILPGAFLPVAEKFGLIAEIDRWVVKRAIRRAALGKRVEVNLSAASIGTLGLLSFIDNEIRAANADPANLVFEITETALMQDIDLGEAFAQGLSNLGCGLALDDFGTGFGSFTYLKRLPVDYLKIDIEFTRDLEFNVANRHVIHAIVSLAHAFGLQTIAEGVEDEATLELLREDGVDFAQGYYLGRPAPIDDSDPNG
jgi:PAS domain S-box-containing protein